MGIILCRKNEAGRFPDGKIKKHLTLFMMNDVKIHHRQSQVLSKSLEQFLYRLSDHIPSFMQAEIIQHSRSNHCKGVLFL